MSDFLGDIFEAIFGETVGNVVDWFAENSPAWVLGLSFLALVGLTVFLFVAVHWSLGLLGALASMFLGLLWVIKLRFG